ncbi:LysR family transcriptional regulator [Oceanicella sp. SM1341]|uniref:LysR family transcriptional regulator n=1 Tax=Oceanicella sp. SM1341 TaxID=1548889 RepID=UPI000E504B37|nr:LysR family transcriptional regulator [Oceanicella sp. SM1341]
MATRFTLRQLEYLVAVGEAGSIARASARIHVSPPSISAAIAQLEAEFGLQLFIRRHSHGLALTTGGRRFFLAARQLLAEAEGLHALAGDISEQVRGPLGLGCLLTVAETVLPDLRRGFETAWPEVRITQHIDNQQRLIDLLLGGEIDAALTYDMDIPPEIGFEPVATLAPYAVLPAEHALAGQRSVRLEELASAKLVLLDLPFSRDYFLGLFSARGLAPRIAERAGDMAMMRAMVANGFGYSLANVPPRSATSPDGKPLAHLSLEGRHRPLALGLARPVSRRQSRALTTFAAHCHATLPHSLAGVATP